MWSVVINFECGDKGGVWEYRWSVGIMVEYGDKGVEWG